MLLHDNPRSSHAQKVRFLLDEAVPAVELLQSRLHPFSAYAVLPLFALANAGVPLSLGDLSAALTSEVGLGIILGLVVGKLVGVLGTSLLAIRLGLADLPVRAKWSHMTGVAFLCGIGFTMSLFIGLLAFPDSEEMQNAVKFGILAGSVAAALLGTLVLILSPRPAVPDETETT